MMDGKLNEDWIGMFKTDNLYFVPEDGRLIFLDLHAGEQFELDVLGLRVQAAAGLRDTMKKKLSAALQEHWKENRSLTTDERNGQMRQTQDFFDALEWMEAGAAYEAAYPLEAVMAPLETTLWVRLSDAPLESFAAEDYVKVERKGEGDSNSGARSGAGSRARDAAKSSRSGSGSSSSSSSSLNASYGEQWTPVYGALEIRALDQWELKLPGAPGEMPFFLRWPDARRAVARGPINALEPLPLVEEYIGPEGVSARGNVANYTLRGALADDNTGAVPLYQREGRLFVTLYFHIAQALEFDVIFNRLPARPETVNTRLAANGFQPVNHGPGWAIYARDEVKDIIHYYYDIEGKEALALPRTHPFLWVARAGGRGEPGERSKLMEEMAGLFPEPPRKLK